MVQGWELRLEPPDSTNADLAWEEWSEGDDATDAFEGRVFDPMTWTDDFGVWLDTPQAASAFERWYEDQLDQF